MQCMQSLQAHQETITSCRPCRADAHEVMQYMRAVQAAQLDPDDPLTSYMLQASPQLFAMLLFLHFSGCRFKQLVPPHFAVGWMASAARLAAHPLL